MPAKQESLGPQLPPAPLLIPGRPYVADTLRKTREQKAREYLHKGRVLEADGNPQAALFAYRDAVSLDPELPGAYQHIGQIYEGFGMEVEAAKAFAAEVTHHPQNREAARQLGVALVRAGEFNRGVEQLELLVRRHPDDGASWRALGFAYTYLKRFTDAERALRNAIRLPPEEAEEWRDLGVLLANRGREAEARRAFERSAKLDPHDGSVWVDLGNLESRAGRLEEALADYRTAEERDTSGVLAYRGQVQTLIALRRDDEVSATYRRWLRRAPEDPNARLDAVRWFAAQGRTDVALEMGRDGVRLSPRSGEMHLVMGVAWGAAGDARSSLLELRRAEHYLGPTADLSQVRSLIAELRAGAPDSLRRLFVADSLAALETARRDSAAIPGITGPKRVP